MRKALWQDSEVKYMDRVAKEHDKELFALRNSQGIINIMRRSKRQIVVYQDNEETMYLVEDMPQYVFSITENWATTGRPVRWGAEVVLSRLKSHDIQTNEAFFRQMEEQERRLEESKTRDLKNSNEAWLSDNHSRFKKAFNDIRVANMDKSDSRRRKRFET